MTVAIKLLGCALILCAGGLTAMSLVTLEKRKLRVLDGWIDLIFYIRSQIDCYLTPIGEILREADEDLLKHCCVNGRCESLDTVLQRSRFYLNEESKRLISSFVREIGSSYREEQVKRCDYYAAALRSVREKQMEGLPSRLRVCVAISLCGACGVAVLLW